MVPSTSTLNCKRDDEKERVYSFYETYCIYEVFLKEIFFSDTEGIKVSGHIFVLGDKDILLNVEGVFRSFCVD